MPEESAGAAGELADLIIVEDSSVQLGILARMLTDQGYAVRPFRDGRKALEDAAQSPPDLILLDINMPEMNGYEVCLRLKENPKLREIPVIFISAKYELEDKIEAFNCGGVDYMPKPYQNEEVRIRVETHLKLSRLQRDLAEHNRRLEDLVSERTRELAEANERLNRLDHAKNEFLQLISHELRTPLNGVLGIADTILNKCAGHPAVERLGSSFRDAQHNLLAIVDDALLLTEIEVSAQPLAADRELVSSLVAEANTVAGKVAESRRVVLGGPPACEAEIHGDRTLLIHAFTALLETAVKLSSSDETVTWAAATDEKDVHLTLEALGSSIPEDALPRLFAPFSITEPIIPGGDLGLRLVVAERILSLLGGAVQAENLGPNRVRFTITLPHSEEAG